MPDVESEIRRKIAGYWDAVDRYQDEIIAPATRIAEMAGHGVDSWWGTPSVYIEGESIEILYTDRDGDQRGASLPLSLLWTPGGEAGLREAVARHLEAEAAAREAAIAAKARERRQLRRRELERELEKLKLADEE